jgi:hypothetical protein
MAGSLMAWQAALHELLLAALCMRKLTSYKLGLKSIHVFNVIHQIQ